MSRAATMSRRPAKTKASAKGFLPDRIAGGVALLLDVLLLAMIVKSANGIRQAGLAMTHGGMIDAVVLGLNLVAHIGVFRGARWGFFPAAALAAWGLFDHGVVRGAQGIFMAPNLWMLVFAAFRLGSAYGPKVR